VPVVCRSLCYGATSRLSAFGERRGCKIRTQPLSNIHEVRQILCTRCGSRSQANQSLRVHGSFLMHARLDAPVGASFLDISTLLTPGAVVVSSSHILVACPLHF